MDFLLHRKENIFTIARACAHAFEKQQKSFVMAMIFTVSCFAAADQAKTVNPKIERARAAIVNKSSTAQADIRRDLAGESDPKVRTKLVSLLGHTKMDSSSVASVRERLADSDPAVRAEAAVALAQSGDQNAASDLRNTLLKDPSEGVRMTAAFWLGALKDRSSIPALSKALSEDSDPHVRAQAAHSLKWVGTTAARNELRKGRGDRDGRVRKITNE